MDRTEYLTELDAVLGRYTDAAAEKISAIQGACPQEATTLCFDIFPDQDGAGTFDVWARLDGPDSFLLNRPVDGHRHLFGIVYTEDGIEPEVPLWSRSAPFSVPDAVVDAAAKWVGELWSRVGQGRSPLPWYVEGHDGYGTVTPLEFTPTGR